MIEIRSFRRVFAVERRIYRIDRFRLNPGGVPIRGIVYLVAILAAELLLLRLPLVGGLGRRVPWYLRELALPGLLAAALTVLRFDGRTFHLAGQALVRKHLARPGALDSSRPRVRCWRPGAIVFMPDGSDRRLRRLTYTGPGAVRVAVEHRRTGRSSERAGRAARGGVRRPVVVITAAAAAGPLARDQIIVLGEGARMQVMASGRR